VSGTPLVELLIFPCNGNGLEALDCLGGTYRFLGFLDDASEKQGIDRHGHRVMRRERLAEFSNAQVLAVPGGPKSFRLRKEIIRGLHVPNERFATVVHPSARISPLASIGRNVLIMAGVVVTSNARIGNHVCVLPNSVILHDVAIGDSSLIGANVTLAGSVVVGEGCYVASGTSVMNDIAIADGALIGLGSNVIRDVAARTTVAGNPARVLAS
jgi:sugar O-acyltransferase (sialic acid O-acetyltransferase NeuD family)